MQASRGSVKLWPLFCFGTLGPAIHMDVTLTCAIYLRTVVNHVHPFTEMVFPDGCVCFQLCHKANNGSGMVWFYSAAIML